MRICSTTRSNSSFAPARGIDIGLTKASYQYVLATDDVQRQVAVMPVVAVKESPLLVAVQHIVRSIQVQDDALRRLRKAIHEQVHQKRINLLEVRRRTFVTILYGFLFLRQLQPIERLGTCKQMALVWLTNTVLSGHVRTSHSQRQGRIIPQTIVVIDILVAQTQTEDPLCQHALHAMFDPVRITIIRKALRKPTGHVASFIDLPQELGTRIGGHASAIKPPDYLAPSQIRNMQGFRLTVCGHSLYTRTGA